MSGEPPVGARAEAKPALTSFLRKRRERLGPRKLGLVPTVAQRGPGLSRAQCARLSGLSSKWYGLIESGAASGVSPGSVRAISRALQLSPEDDAKLWRLMRRVYPRL